MLLRRAQDQITPEIRRSESQAALADIQPFRSRTTASRTSPPLRMGSLAPRSRQASTVRAIRLAEPLSPSTHAWPE